MPARADSEIEPMRSLQRGFTIVEIAVVLVIIGLLVGGILKGQEMITQAKIKRVIADFNGVSAAYYAYRDRYRAVPGNDPNAATRWAGAISGDGDGHIGGLYNSANANDESRLFWDHLRRAGLVSGTGSTQPFNAVFGLMGAQTGDGAGPSYGPVLGIDASGTGGLGGMILCSANVPDKIAIGVDAQMDDGAPATGAVHAQLQSAPNPPIRKQAAVAYAETGANAYTLCQKL
jgi:prepilin-type N-terminal cleavage/methylation domain-containing protein